MKNITGPIPVDTETTQHLLNALRAKCIGDAIAFTEAFDEVQGHWERDPLAALASTTLVSAVAVKQIVHPGRPVLAMLAWTLGKLTQQPISDDLKLLALDVVFRLAEGTSPNFVEAFGFDQLTWCRAGSAMAAFTHGLILANTLETTSTVDATMDRLCRVLVATF